MTCRIQLIRHGQVHSDWQGRIYGCLDVPLSTHGEQEARRAAAHLATQSIDAVVSTGLARSEFGAKCIAEPRGLTVHVEGQLREIERGSWAKLTFDELERQSPGAMDRWTRDPWNQSPPGGETLDDLMERVTKALNGIADRFASQTVAIVAHRHVLRCALAGALGRTESLGHIIPTGVIVTLDWSSTSKPVLVATENFESPDN